MATNTVPNQANYQTNQNFDIDINKIYTDFIQQIDAVRSIINIQVNSSLLNTFDIKTVTSLGSKLKIGTTVQESRVHAFYRLLGLPVISKSGKFYNPGLDNIGGVRTIQLADKVSIANGVDPNFSTLSLQRENYINGILQIYNQNPSTITASALALTSSIHTRAFSIPTTNTSPTSFNPSDQQYTPIFDSIVGQYHVILDNYMDANGNLPLPSLHMPRYHFIQPFMVDPRIDFTVNPASNLIAVPFVPTKQNLLVSENNFVKRPLIEKIIRDRFLNTQATTVTSGQQKIIDYILNVPTVTNDSLISQMVNSPYIKNNSAQFEKYLFMIQAMCVQLIKSQLDIQVAQSRYYWIPAPAINIGPEGGSDIQGIIISPTMTSNLITVPDRAIINQTLNQASNNFDTASAAAAGVPDLGGFAFDGGTNFFDLTFDQTTSTSLGDITTAQLTNLNKKRNHDLGVANTALQNIEVIMGEWSGLGLCDIVAIMASLYTMDQNTLLGFLDADALQRCNTQLGIDTSSAPSITVALTTLIQSVNNYYHLMDDIYKNLASSNGLST
jgi:hypothetical protein